MVNDSLIYDESGISLQRSSNRRSVENDPGPLRFASNPDFGSSKPVKMFVEKSKRPAFRAHDSSSQAEMAALSLRYLTDVHSSA